MFKRQGFNNSVPTEFGARGEVGSLCLILPYWGLIVNQGKQCMGSYTWGVVGT